jgi:hypothetical protein
MRQALLDDPEGLPAHLERVLVALETVSQQIGEADVELRIFAEADARMTRLMTVPGVGPVTAARFVAAIDDVARFPKIADRRGAQVAIMALARKLAHVLYALWKHEAPYDPSRAARLVAA